MRLTDFKLTKRGRIALYTDGEFLLSVPPDVFATSGLRIGAEVDEERLAELTAESELKKAKEKALSLLSGKEYTSHMLTQRLKRQTDEETAGLAVERMQELGLLDDEDYAVRYARELSGRKRFGPMRVRQEMRRRGLDDDQIAFATSLLEDDPDENMRAVLEKKYPRAPEDETVRRRAFSALVRLGYRPGDARRAVSAFCGGREALENEADGDYE